MAEFGQALLLILSLAWISQSVPKPEPIDLSALADTTQAACLMPGPCRADSSEVK